MRIKLIALFIMMGSLAAVADNDTYFFSKVDYQQGLSNSAVLCLFQDNVGLMWFGTYDGVNCWDGKTMEVFRSDFSESKTLSNNVIHSISQADNSCLWISTHLGVNRFSQKARQVVANYDFQVIIMFILIIRETLGYLPETEFTIIIRIINVLSGYKLLFYQWIVWNDVHL